MRELYIVMGFPNGFDSVVLIMAFDEMEDAECHINDIMADNPQFNNMYIDTVDFDPRH